MLSFLDVFASIRFALGNNRLSNDPGRLRYPLRSDGALGGYKQEQLASDIYRVALYGSNL